MADTAATAMARAIARARGQEPTEESSSAASSEAGPSEREVRVAQRLIARWGKKRLSRTRVSRRVGNLDDASLGSRAAALQSSRGAKRAAVPPLVVVPNVLPGSVAQATLTVLRAVPEDSWELATAGTDIGERAEGSGTAAHRFSGISRGDVPALEPVFVALEMLLGQPMVIQCGRYQRGDFIEPHDDMAYVQVKGVEHSRDVAAVLHLTPDWHLKDGGTFVDHAGGIVRSPVFNSLVAFRVPRLHEVSPVLGRAARFSIYGWFLAPGRLYELGDARSQSGRKRKRAKKQ